MRAAVKERVRSILRSSDSDSTVSASTSSSESSDRHKRVICRERRVVCQRQRRCAQPAQKPSLDLSDCSDDTVSLTRAPTRNASFGARWFGKQNDCVTPSDNSWSDSSSEIQAQRATVKEFDAQRFGHHLEGQTDFCAELRELSRRLRKKRRSESSAEASDKDQLFEGSNYTIQDCRERLEALTRKAREAEKQHNVFHKQWPTNDISVSQRQLREALDSDVPLMSTVGSKRGIAQSGDLECRDTIDSQAAIQKKTFQLNKMEGYDRARLLEQKIKDERMTAEMNTVGDQKINPVAKITAERSAIPCTETSPEKEDVNTLVSGHGEVRPKSHRLKKRGSEKDEKNKKKRFKEVVEQKILPQVRLASAIRAIPKAEVSGTKGKTSSQDRSKSNQRETLRNNTAKNMVRVSHEETKDSTLKTRADRSHTSRSQKKLESRKEFISMDAKASERVKSTGHGRTEPGVKVRKTKTNSPAERKRPSTAKDRTSKPKSAADSTLNRDNLNSTATRRRSKDSPRRQKSGLKRQDVQCLDLLKSDDETDSIKAPIVQLSKKKAGTVKTRDAEAGTQKAEQRRRGGVLKLKLNREESLDTSDMFKKNASFKAVNRKMRASAAGVIGGTWRKTKDALESILPGESGGSSNLLSFFRGRSAQTKDT